MTESQVADMGKEELIAIDVNALDKFELKILAKRLLKEMSHKQRIWALEYMVDRNGTRAAIASGYSKRSAENIAYQLKTTPVIMQYLNVKLRQYESKASLKRARIIEELDKIAFSNINDIVRIHDDTMSIYDSDSFDGSIVQEISVSTGKAGVKKTVKLYDKLNALEKLMKHYEMYDISRLQMARTKLEIDKMRYGLADTADKVEDDGFLAAMDEAADAIMDNHFGANAEVDTDEEE